MVDDHVMVRQLIADVLAPGDRYNVLLAENGTEGLERSREFVGEIHLLVAAFRMPGMSGIALATAVTVDRPKLKVLLMSGFPENTALLNECWRFLAKPFTVSELRTLVAELLFPD